MEHDDSAGAFAAVQGIRSGRFDRFLAPLAAEIRLRDALIDPARPPKRTLEMTDNAQVWAWIGSQWEIRGTGAKCPS